MSYAKVMASLNASRAASGVEVEVKKRTPDGSYIPADDRDFATADFDAELEAAVKADPENGKFAIKDKDTAMAAAFAFLRSKGAFPDDDDDDDDEPCFGDDAFDNIDEM